MSGGHQSSSPFIVGFAGVILAQEGLRRAKLLSRMAVRLVHPWNSRKSLIRATPPSERRNPLKIAFLAQNRFHLFNFKMTPRTQFFGPQSHLNMKLNPRRMLFRSMMTPQGSELIKNLTTVHENGGARKIHYWTLVDWYGWRYSTW